MNTSARWTFCAVLLFLASSAEPQDKAAEPAHLDEIQIVQILNAPAHLDFEETPLDEVCETLSRHFDIQAVLDTRALDEVGIGADTPVTFRATAPLRLLISKMLYDIDPTVTWSLHDGLVIVTTREAAEENLQIRIFDVSRIMHDDNDFDGLIELITNTVEPDAWDEVGGPGSIHEYATPSVQALVIASTYQMHCKIEDLLVHLHHLAGQTTAPSRRVRSVPRIVARSSDTAESWPTTTPRSKHGLRRSNDWNPRGLPMTRPRPTPRRSSAATPRRYVESPSWMDAALQPNSNAKRPVGLSF